MSIGEDLAAARQRAGLTITQVSERTRIRAAIIRGIERDDFAACGGDFYARGHIRAIARAEGADPEPMIAEYDSLGDVPPAGPGRGSQPGTPPAGRGQDTPPAGSRQHAPPPGTAGGGSGLAGSFRPREPRRPNWSVALLIVLAAVVGLIIYHVVASHPARSAAAAAHQSAAAHKAASSHPAATSTPTSPAASPTPAPSDVVIALTAVSETCWVNLTTSGGATIFQGIMDPGTSKTWTERQAVTLQLGNPGAVTLTVDGKGRAGLGPNPVTLSLGPGQGTSAP